MKALMKRAFDKGKEKGFAWLQKELENRQVIIVGSNWRVVIPGWVAFKIIKPFNQLHGTVPGRKITL